MDWWSQISDPLWWGSLVASFALSALVTWLSILYARRRKMLDLPGRRRSHSVPTPRGGGIGIVVSSLVFFCGPFLFAARIADKAFGFAVTTALILVAAIGWLDDHRSLSARVRIVVHFVAALVLITVPLAGELLVMPSEYAHAVKPDLMLFGVGVALVGAVSLIIVWSINLHNFMDGINGILAYQAVFVFATLGALTSSPSHQSSMWYLAAATLGFLPFNFPDAKIFMGDIGSGALGLLIVVAAAMTLNTIHPPFVPALIAVSAFVTDATCTLISRMLRGRRWYSAHREHLYQWMTRTGMSHTRVVLWYSAWNLLIVLPVLLWAAGVRVFNAQVENPVVAYGSAAALSGLNDRMWGASVATAIVYSLAIALWIFGKRWCLYKVKNAIKQKV